MRIRIAQRLVIDGAYAQTLESGNDGPALHIPWVEIDGQRIEGVNSAKVSMSQDGVTTVLIDFRGAAEIVFVDQAGVELV